MKTALRLIAILALAFLAACATPQSFNERLLAGYSTVTEIRNGATAAVGLKQIDSADAENIQAQANTARSGLDLARSMRPTQPQSAENKLSSVQTIISALKAYLLAKGVK